MIPLVVDTITRLDPERQEAFACSLPEEWLDRAFLRWRHGRWEPKGLAPKWNSLLSEAIELIEAQVAPQREDVPMTTDALCDAFLAKMERIQKGYLDSTAGETGTRT